MPNTRTIVGLVALALAIVSVTLAVLPSRRKGEGAAAPASEKAIEEEPRLFRASKERRALEHPDRPENGALGELARTGSYIAGRVIDKNGAAIVGALVRVELLGASTSPPFSADDVTDADGAFGLSRREVPLRSLGDRPVLVVVEKHGYRTRRVEFAGAALDVPFVVTLEVDADLTGVVVDISGVPVEGAQIDVEGLDGSVFKTSAIADALGCFAIQIEGDGMHLITAYANRRGLRQLAPILLRKDKTTDVGQIVVGGPAQIEGTARFADGTAASHILVYARQVATDERSRPTVGLRSASARTDAMGFFRMRGLSDADYALGIGGLSPKCFSPALIRARAGTFVDVVVTGHLLLVSIDHDGRTLTDAAVSFSVADEKPRVLSSRSSAADGVYRFYTCRPGDFLVSASHPELGDGRAVAVIQEGVHQTLLHISIGQSAAYGTVRCVFQPVAKVGEPSGSIVLRDLVDGGVLTVGGHGPLFQFEVPVGGYAVDWRPSPTAYPQAYLPAHDLQRVEVFEGQTADVHVRPRMGGWLRMRLRCASTCEEAAAATVELPTGERQRISSIVRNADGVTVSRDLYPNVDIAIGGAFATGIYKISVDHHEQTLSTEISVAAGNETYVEFGFDGD